MSKILTTKLLIVWILISSIANAQNHQPEYLYANFDKHFYIAGEDLWYSVYILNPSDKQSGIVHTELLAADGKTVIKQMLKFDGYQAIGDIALPPSLEEGYYQFRAYTHWNLNFSPQVIFSKDIPIFKADHKFPQLAPMTIPDYVPARSEVLNFSINGERFQPRASIQLSFEAPTSGHLSVSIIDMSYLNKEENTNIINYQAWINNQTPPQFINSEQFIEAEQQHQRTLMLRKPETGDYVNSNFIVGFIKQTQQKLIRRSKNGIVTLDFDDFYDSTIVQIFDAHPHQKAYIPLASIIDEQHPVDPPRLRRNKPVMTPEIQRYIRNYQKRFQLYQLFGTKANMRAEYPQPIAPKYTPTSIYKIDDFISLESMEAFIKQATPSLRVKISGKKDQKQKSFALFVPGKDMSRKRVINPPLLLVNNYFTYNAEAVFNMEWENIKQIDVFNTAATLPPQFGPIGDFGVIAFHTRDGQTPEEILKSTNNLKVPGFYLARKFETSGYQKDDIESSKIPNFRPMMYWNAHIDLTENGSTSLSFPAADQAGTYLIRIEGLLDDGSPVYTERVFEIVMER